ncbi:hypothetical protein H4582DRAFT_2059402 [Lactarius indigo]|nr:hypothetical protein H4582DRAFT_2059402 [Lactarius indigo]
MAKLSWFSGLYTVPLHDTYTVYCVVELYHYRLVWEGRPSSILVGTLSVDPLINYGVWTHEPASDFDRIAHVTSDSGWSWKYLRSTLIELLPRIVTTRWGKSIRRPTVQDGPSQDQCSEHDSWIFNTTTQLAEFPFNEDMNSGNLLMNDVTQRLQGWVQLSIGGGQRSSASVSYLTPILWRSNFDVLVNTLVTKVVFPFFRGAQFVQSASGVETSASLTTLSHDPARPTLSCGASKVVILAARAVNTAQLLKLLGIGDSAQLSRLSTWTIVNLPDVGKNM